LDSKDRGAPFGAGFDAGTTLGATESELASTQGLQATCAQGEPSQSAPGPRYAIYFVPDSPLGRLGERWLAPDFGPAAAHTANARRYGFHATIKAPFRLASGRTALHLSQALAAWAREQQALAFRLRIDCLDGFLALLPASESEAAALSALAASAVVQLDPLRAPLRDEERARRMASGLSAREAQLLERWGYPYVLEAFRFHCTLSAVVGESERFALRDLAQRHFDAVLSQSVVLDELALVCEPAPHEQFVVLERFRLGAA